ncbi:hypothetical protein STEG23_005191, partial [Scotinomys teguina]
KLRDARGRNLRQPLLDPQGYALFPASARAFLSSSMNGSRVHMSCEWGLQDQRQVGEIYPDHWQASSTETFSYKKEEENFKALQDVDGTA